mmetsp:Transcript_28216/g.51030  ORF Transcript_28216/g.51030 Transcript_28216/m.51030 type:complete len:121 (-) Transcript_28216:254-616(-)|eukprot:CAMPEP_0201883856 /NCGR_PEP_ID=MMETSP0902-20130614/16274_1 /ASSEMBLY_ACC=CAM_ASM_000551 /TAXON_ID=420261 /ORGANISM="Thalassiosira antarctica, Strain CCMP982" /LENGTH=120 /DNA_ID=CAMNT_0048412723 /DNA_START=290 /DNA_END=652 /DNA_ORIENTATION=-
MAQGAIKLKSNKSDSKKARPAHKNKKQSQNQVTKGWKSYAAKGRKTAAAKHDTSTTKGINVKNEIAVAARAVGAGNTFYLRDIREAGKKQIGKQQREQRKKENNAKMSERLKVQLQGLKK